MLKVSLIFTLLSLSIAHADVVFDDLINQNLIEESNLANEVQQFAGVDHQKEKKSAADYVSAQTHKDADFQVVLRKKKETKNPVIQRSIASKINRVDKKLKKKKVKKLSSVSSID